MRHLRSIEQKKSDDQVKEAFGELMDALNLPEGMQLDLCRRSELEEDARKTRRAGGTLEVFQWEGAR